MVYNLKTLEASHELTEQGKVEYQKMLDAAADDILFRAQHPIKWLFGRIMSFFGI